jgi:hypothetical protein
MGDLYALYKVRKIFSLGIVLLAAEGLLEHLV